MTKDKGLCPKSNKCFTSLAKAKVSCRDDINAKPGSMVFGYKQLTMFSPDSLLWVRKSVKRNWVCFEVGIGFTQVPDLDTTIHCSS